MPTTLLEALQPFKWGTLEQVTAILIADDAKGYTQTVCGCPVAVYVGRRVETHVSVSRGGIGYSYNDDNTILFGTYPEWDGLVSFIDRFDTGRVPETLYADPEQYAVLQMLAGANDE